MKSPEAKMPLIQSCDLKPVSSGLWETNGRKIYRPTWAEIDKKALTHNFKKIKSFLKPKTKIMAVVKANAYGHCAEWASETLLNAGASCLGVACLEEGIALRESGIKAEILILGSMFPLENFAVADRYDLTPTISSLKGLEELIKAARGFKSRMKFHLKIDTGMGRMGASVSGAMKILDLAASSEDVRLAGIYTHFSVAGTDKNYSTGQVKKFDTVIRYAKKLGLEFISHVSNSAAILRYKDWNFDMVRPGIMLYGMYPFHGARKKINLLPVLSWKTRIAFIKKVPKAACISYSRTCVTKRPSVIATLPVGYADGYLRRFSNKAEVLVRGKRCRVAGRVTMDMIMVDVTDVPGVSLGDEVVLMGAQGSDKIRAEELANIAGTINYEITCGISYRVPRVLV